VNEAPTEPVVAPYGTWRSPVGPELVARATTIVSGARLVDDAVWWLELRPHEGGRSALVRSDTFGEPADVTPEGFDVRTLVHEYGGGAFTAFGPTAYVTSFVDQRLYRLELGGEPTPITPEPATSRADRFADMDVSPDGTWIACVRERHHGDGRVENEIVTLPTDGSAEPRVVASGSDFVSSPRFSPDGGRLAWLRWDFPRMPWDGTELLGAPFEDGALGDAEHVAGGERESICQPVWSPDGVLHFVSDRTDWWNLYRREDDGSATNLTPEPAEFGVPGWEFRYASYAFLGDGRIVCAYRRSGTHHLAILDPATTELLDLDVPYGCFSPPFVSASGNRIALVGSGPTTGREVVLLDVVSRSVEVLRPAEDLGVDPSVVSIAEPIEFPTDDGRTAHAYFYRPTNPAFRGPDEERPPLVVKGHGGPTSETTPDLKAAIQFFTSRGFGVVDVNYGGSTGYGRAYRERLYGAWGVVDVGDCIAAARHLAAEGRVDEDRMVVTGGSAGGYIVLAAMAFHPTAFAAGTSYFGVADLEPFATDTHKFESKYIDVLVGPWPESAELWRERSPIHRADDIERPLLLLQGLEDPVVPPAQAEVMLRALERRRVPHAYLAFEGEQHGFRRAETIVRSLQAELAFYGRVLGFEPADELPPLDVRFLAD
jgi:dipeptidyl aminopeptidase/acylaminoacyl peptidase